MNINNNMNNMMQNENIGNEEEEINDNQIDDNNININRIQQKEGDIMLNKLNNINKENESLKNMINNLEQKCSLLSQENEQLKITIQKNKAFQNKTEPNYELMENSIRQGTILLNDNKKKNETLKQKILKLEKTNKELNFKLIESNQVLKRLQTIIKTKNININNNNEINKLNNIIDEKEIKISKLSLDKKTLEQRLEEYQKSHENELKLMLDYKNSELAVYQNIIDKYKNNNNNINNNFNISSSNTKNNSNNNNTNNDLKIKNLQIQINKMRQEIENKNKTINLLNKKINKFNDDYNKKISELKQSSNENINQTQEQVEQLIIERDELLRKNENLTKGLVQFNDKIKEVNLIYNNKTENFNKMITLCKDKIKDYKYKINLLKKKNDELNMVLKKMGMKNNNDNMYNSDIYNSNDNCLTGRNETFSINRYYDRQINSPMNRNRKIMLAHTDNRNNIKNNFNTFDRNEISYQDFDDPLDLSQKKYLENYKIFLSGLDKQLNK